MVFKINQLNVIGKRPFYIVDLEAGQHLRVINNGKEILHLAKILQGEKNGI